MQQRKDLEDLGKRILNELKTELYLAMRFMGPALDRLEPAMDLSTLSVGTDAECIRYNPTYLARAYLADPRKLLRCCMHILIHCLFRHMFAASRYDDRELFSLCADIAAEALIDSMEEPVLMEVPSDFREETIRSLREELRVLTAEKLYRHYSGRPRDFDLEKRLASEFGRDDHSFWERMNKEKPGPEQNDPQNPLRQRENDWKNAADSTRKLLAAFGPEASDRKGRLSRTLSLQDDSRTDYREFLKKLSTVREEARVDPDNFDYAYYHYGIELYGNMPLIEENEYREIRRIDELVIAIDTSASTQARQVRKFLNETAHILSSRETFFHHVEIHLIECDDQIQNDLHLTDVKELHRHADSFAVHGGMGTDFRPVFRYVEELRKRGKLADLRGLMYFTDGYGIYPEEPACFDTAFVFCTDEDYDDTRVPAWAMKLYT